ncbi:LPS assembly lipoprotein LptE [Chloroherpeton thalassium]|nr:LPS assembly lipoprotein LptE [Chloroherpeton thalassium]
MATLSGCYSFSEGSLPSHIKTIAIPVFGDESSSGIGQLREQLTTKMVDHVQSQSSLVIEQDRRLANSVMEAVIKSYSDEPSQVSSTTERATQNRISITISVTYKDLVTKKTLFTQSFTGISDYAIGDFTAQQESIEEAIDQVSDDILNRLLAGAGW